MSNLKRIREASGLSRARLSEISGVGIRVIEGYEQGLRDINKAQGEILYKLSQALECKIEDILKVKEIDTMTIYKAMEYVGHLTKSEIEKSIKDGATLYTMDEYIDSCRGGLMDEEEIEELVEDLRSGKHIDGDTYIQEEDREYVLVRPL